MTFTAEQQQRHRETFIHDCRQKAWGAACHAHWIGAQLDKLIEDYGKLKAEDEKLDGEADARSKMRIYLIENKLVMV
jgi:hypothetical protein